MTETAPQLQPLYLLADSQLLFCKRRDRLLLDAALDGLARDTQLSAAYIGASNGDRPEFYGIFEAAVDAIGITDRRMIDSSFGPDDRAFLERAQLVVLAGGDVRLGWNTFEKTGMKEVILGRYVQGAVLVGISAGAVQLGRYGVVETPESPATELLEVFRLVSLVIDTHDERAQWARLSRTIHLLEGAAIGLGIPSGGGVMVHPDATIEPLRRPAHEFRFEGTRVTHSLLCAEEGNRLWFARPVKPQNGL
ncbi:MAG: Type 1 glutamine amidotransferase-like domain-containing protein [Mycobacterium sp.]|nr:Type 1 glutamine amidotransferase-like domain-containing protein [Mycobacterium sp.]